MQTRHSGLSERTPLGPPTRVCSAHSPWTTDLASGCVVVELSQYPFLVSRTFAHRASRRAPGSRDLSVSHLTSDPHLKPYGIAPHTRSHTAHVLLGAKTKLVMYTTLWGRYRVFTHYCVLTPTDFGPRPPLWSHPTPIPIENPPPPRNGFFGWLMITPSEEVGGVLISGMYTITYHICAWRGDKQRTQQYPIYTETVPDTLNHDSGEKNGYF